MPRIVLLPDWNQDPEWAGIIGNAIPFDADKPSLADVKDDWQPVLQDVDNIGQVEAFAFPTPFAWAEMMAAVIRQGDYDHLLFKYYEQLVLGVLLGHLRLDVADLKEGDFGRVLAGADDRYRYFGTLRGRGTPENRDLEGLVFGGTSPDCIFWPAPRRTEGEWRLLREAIRGSNQELGYQLLADYRHLIAQERLWEPNRYVWMKGLDRIAGAREPEPGNNLFHVHSRLVGPVALASGANKPFYFPVYEKEFAALFLRGLTGSLRVEGQGIGVYDQYRKCLEIALPTVTADGDLARAGGGVVRLLHEPARPPEGGGTIRLRDENGSRGLFSLVQDLRNVMEGDVVAIKRRPFLYPDVFRVPVTRLGEAGLGNEVSFSPQAYDELTFEADSPGLPLASELEQITDNTDGVVLNYRDERGQTRRAIYIDSYAGAPVGDLKALGLVLWSYFVGEAEVFNGKLVDREGTPVFKDQDVTRPFDFYEEVAPELYGKVRASGAEYRRLAAQQRFLRAYRELAAEEGSNLAQLCYRAARSFVRWTWPEWLEKAFIENGHQPRHRQPVQLGSLKVTLLKDEPVSVGR